MEQANLFIALGGLLILALILASALRRYQEVMAERRMRVRRILRGVDQIKDMLGRVSGCPLPVVLAKVLHQDILNRLMMVKQIGARYEGIDTLIAEALEEGGQIVESQRFDITDNQQLQKITRALGEMIAFIRNGSLLTPLTAQQAAKYTELTAARLSESVYRYHIEQAKKLRDEDELSAALKHCNSIKAFLKGRGPSSSQAQAWVEEAEALGKALNEAIDSSAPAA